MIIPHFTGEIETMTGQRWMYATDASIYRQMPAAVVFPRDESDLQHLVHFAKSEAIGLIPRGAGTSLAGQCVGDGIVVDMTRHMNRILSLDLEAGRAVVQPGVVRDELNRQLAETPWIFGPNTSTSNRATIGGMVGNNSSGTTSLTYGVTRDKVIRLKTVMSDGSAADIHARSIAQSSHHPILARMDRWLINLASDDERREAVYAAYPDLAIHRRSTGYAIDSALRQHAKGWIDWPAVYCGSEGTLGLFAEIELSLDRRQPSPAVLVTIAYDDLDTALRHVPLLLDHAHPYALELMDHHIWDCVSGHTTYQRYQRHLSCVSPKAVLMMELRAERPDDLQDLADKSTTILPPTSYQSIDHCYDDAIVELWDMRKAGLGILANIDGEAEAIACIEDTAVHPHQLADYIREVDAMMKSYGQDAVYYAHAGAGELHIRPVLDLATPSGRKELEAICIASADLVKKYNGALSGEHGDGRVRGALLPRFLGDQVYGELVALKRLADPDDIFNPGKITAASALLDDLKKAPVIPRSTSTWASEALRCTGSGDCLKSRVLSPGMCPTYQAVAEEVYSTRGRANILQQAALQADHDIQTTELAVKSCLSCKACQTECPSSVDMAWMKSHYLHEMAPPKSLRDRLISRSAEQSAILGRRWVRSIAKSSLVKPIFRAVGLHQSLADAIGDQGVFMKRASRTDIDHPTLYLIIDEFTNVFQADVASSAMKVLTALGARPQCIQLDSMRAAISKGDLDYARRRLMVQADMITSLKADLPIVMIEPSAYAVFIDEMNKLLDVDTLEQFAGWQANLWLIGQYLAQFGAALRSAIGRISSEKKVLYHAHCHARAAHVDAYWVEVLQDIGCQVECTPAGCCGMAGSYGYELEHYQMSKSVFDQGLGKDIEACDSEVILTQGMSCRHQVERFSDRHVMHPLVFLSDRMVSSDELK